MSAELDTWILSQRPARAKLDAYLPYEYFLEEECSALGTVEAVATIFLTNRECPFRCLMCDLWRNTLTETVPSGAIPAQIGHALSRLGPASVIKLYNSGSFFDPHAIPPGDYEAIAENIRGFERVIVENHPALVGDDCLRFRDLLNGRLEIAMGLETAHPGVLAKLNKRMTLDQFSRAAKFLRDHDIDFRAFILVQPPYMHPEEALLWAQHSLDFAMESGATAATLIPTRGGNGAMERLMESGDFAPPALHTLESAMEYGLGCKAGRVFADLWGLRASCSHCHGERTERLRQMNLRQVVMERVGCVWCSGAS
jgi:hypothetical protein